jgi:hypothetical protein
MGAEAHLTIAQIGAPGGKFSADAPLFVSEGPVVVLPLYACDYGDWVNLEPMEDWIRDHMAVDHGYLIALIGNGPGVGSLTPIFGVYVMHRSHLYPSDQLFNAAGEGPGGEPRGDLEAAWKQITLGLWLVKKYEAHGVEADLAHWDYPIPEGIEVLKEVTWEIWT